MKNLAFEKQWLYPTRGLQPLPRQPLARLPMQPNI